MEAALREIEARKEEYIKAWFAQHGAMPGDVVLVHREMQGGEWLRVEMRTDTDPVLELVRAARLLLSNVDCDQPDYVVQSARGLECALEHFKRIP